jgi:hypothetical protein
MIAVRGCLVRYRSVTVTVKTAKKTEEAKEGVQEYVCLLFEITAGLQLSNNIYISRVGPGVLF